MGRRAARFGQAMQPELYWISGSPPSWRVMLGFTLKAVPFTSHRLDHSKGENKTPHYLELNPKGQVPTVVAGPVVVRESIAILAWVDRMFPSRPIWGDDPDHAAEVLQDVMLMEGDLRPHVTQTAQSLLHKRTLPQEAIDALLRALDNYSERLEAVPFLGGAQPMASDLWLYPAMHWINRGIELSDTPSGEIQDFIDERQGIASWMGRFADLPGVAESYPPHWRA